MASRKKQATPLETLITQLRTLTNEIAGVKHGDDMRTAKRARHAIDEITQQLTSVAANLDPVLRPESIFDPTDPKTAGRVVALTLVAQDRHPLSAIPDFYGAGVYAIYYRGTFDAYSLLTETDHPIYVGKAEPGHSTAKDAIAQGTKLSERLREHAKNIGKAKSTLSLADFDCRFLIVQTGFQKSAEDYLIRFFKPIWNSETKICFGLGKHGDSPDTRSNKRSPWDTMHPGREWAGASTEDQKSLQTIRRQIVEHLSVNPPYRDINAIFNRFVSDIRQLNSDHFHSLAAGEVSLPESPVPDVGA